MADAKARSRSHMKNESRHFRGQKGSVTSAVRAKVRSVLDVARRRDVRLQMYAAAPGEEGFQFSVGPVMGLEE